MLHLLFMLAIVVIGIAMIPTALVVLLLVAPFLMILAGALILFVEYPYQPHDYLAMGGLGLVLLGGLWALAMFDQL